MLAVTGNAEQGVTGSYYRPGEIEEKGKARKGSVRETHLARRGKRTASMITQMKDRRQMRWNLPIPW